ncbi:hypothetical protein QNI19_00675 [Cytophagaceae bacterium DM2B3-1]|uniref:6-bladed beta-propeller n=1 Tax=Xanthocytophaga flava TaxID=3048013 RepID=A0ABT7CCJ6_9BACT|nr:hypothetical protein [Xanthocytophaga flavus]MDJ1470017.1 hypothetical protein [Xanthocytophaga flavus]MDJ1491419.1 hypothetical protein [Xanthocytophaga flavus]
MKYTCVTYRQCLFQIIFSLLIITTCFPQTPVLVRQISSTPAVAVSVDKYDRLITADEKGNITAYDTLGNALYSYSPAVVGDVSMLEAWRSMQILVFYRDLQQYVQLDRFLTPLPGYNQPARLQTEEIGFARVMTLAYDDQLWIFDDTDFSLKKYDLQRQKVEMNSPLNLILKTQDYQITWIREYQNQLFVADRNSGILVFDNLGNYRKALPFKGLTYFQFLGEELYFTDKETLYFFNIYSHSQRSIKLPVAAKFAILVGRYLAIYTDKAGFLYSFK